MLCTVVALFVVPLMPSPFPQLTYTVVPIFVRLEYVTCNTPKGLLSAGLADQGSAIARAVNTTKGVQSAPRRGRSQYHLSTAG
jgi:hypothetical protein